MTLQRHVHPVWQQLTRHRAGLHESCLALQTDAGFNDRPQLTLHLRVHCRPPAPTARLFPVEASLPGPMPLLRPRRWLLRSSGRRRGLCRGGPPRLAADFWSRLRRSHVRRQPVLTGQSTGLHAVSHVDPMSPSAECGHQHTASGASPVASIKWVMPWEVNPFGSCTCEPTGGHR